MSADTPCKPRESRSAYPVDPAGPAYMVMIAHFRKHWPARKMEWVMSGIAISWGLYTLTHPQMFVVPATREVFSGLEYMNPTSFAAHVFWGAMALLVGLARLIALAVNGLYVRTPVIRLIGACLTAFVFSQVAIGFWQSGIANTGLAVYPWLVVADMVSAYASAKDAIEADAENRARRNLTHGRAVPA